MTVLAAPGLPDWAGPAWSVTDLGMDRPLAVTDCETTSSEVPWLINGRRAWDIGVKRVDPDGAVTALQWFVDVAELELRYANPRALEVGGFHRRHPQANGEHGMMRWDVEVSDDGTWLPGRSQQGDVLTGEASAWRLSSLLGGCVIAGATVQFDVDTYADAINRRDAPPPTWDYHLLNVTDLGAGRALAEASDLDRPAPPYSLNRVAAALGVTNVIPSELRHTAWGDVLFTEAVLLAACGLSRPAAGALS